MDEAVAKIEVFIFCILYFYPTLFTTSWIWSSIQTILHKSSLFWRAIFCTLKRLILHTSNLRHASPMAKHLKSFLSSISYATSCLRLFSPSRSLPLNGEPMVKIVEKRLLMAKRVEGVHTVIRGEVLSPVEVKARNKLEALYKASGELFLYATPDALFDQPSLNALL